MVKPKRVAVVKDFFILGDVRPAPRVKWSGFDQSEIWGKWQPVDGRSYGTVFQEQAVAKVEYIGPPVVFWPPAPKQSAFRKRLRALFSWRRAE